MLKLAQLFLLSELFTKPRMLITLRLLSFINCAIDGVVGQRFAQAALSLGINPGTHFKEEWVHPRAGLDGCGERKSLVLKLTVYTISELTAAHNWNCYNAK